MVKNLPQEVGKKVKKKEVRPHLTTGIPKKGETDKRRGSNPS